MKPQHFLGFDYGKKFMGVAVGSKETGLAQPLTTIRIGQKGPDWTSINKLIDEWKPAALVVGLPIKMDSTDNPITSSARKFGNQLKDRYNLDVHMVDERLTTVEAKHRLQSVGVAIRPSTKSRIDEMAAQTILQSFLDEDSVYGRGVPGQTQTDDKF